MKRVFGWLVLFVVIFGTVACSAEDIEDMDHFLVLEPEFNHQFTEIDQVIFDFEDQVGYRPKFDIDYDEQYVFIYLFRTELKVECLVDKRTNRVLLPDFWISKQMFEANEIVSKFPMSEDVEEAYYSVLNLNSDEYRIVDVNDDGSFLNLTVESHVEGEAGKTFDLVAIDYHFDEVEQEFFVSIQDFRQLWYETYGAY